MKILLALLGAFALVLGFPALFAQPGSPLATASVVFGSTYLGAFVMRRSTLGRRRV